MRQGVGPKRREADLASDRVMLHAGLAGSGWALSCPPNLCTLIQESQGLKVGSGSPAPVGPRLWGAGPTGTGLCPVVEGEGRGCLPPRRRPSCLQLRWGTQSGPAGLTDGADAGTLPLVSSQDCSARLSLLCGHRLHPALTTATRGAGGVLE